MTESQLRTHSAAKAIATQNPLRPMQLKAGDLADITAAVAEQVQTLPQADHTREVWKTYHDAVANEPPQILITVQSGKVLALSNLLADETAQTEPDE